MVKKEIKEEDIYVYDGLPSQSDQYFNSCCELDLLAKD